MSGYCDLLEYEINDTPCLIGVISYYRKPGTFNRNEDSDVDYYGYTEVEWEILDEHGEKSDQLIEMCAGLEEEIEEFIDEYYASYDPC